MDPDIFFAGYLALPWLLPLVTLVLILVGGAALGAVIVAVIGAVRAAFHRGRESDPEEVSTAELFGDIH
jgi:hypothetical protein